MRIQTSWLTTVMLAFSAGQASAEGQGPSLGRLLQEAGGLELAAISVAAQEGTPALAGDFGPTLKAFLAAFPCKSIETCKIPAVDAIDSAADEQESLTPIRLKLVEEGRDKVEQAADLLRLIGRGGGAPGSSFSAFYSYVADKLLADFKGPLDGIAELTGSRSPVVYGLRMARDVISLWQDRIAGAPDAELRDAYALKLAREYAKTYAELERLEHRLAWARYYLLGAEYNSLKRDIELKGFSLDAFLRYEKRYCDVPHEVRVVSRSPRPAAGISWTFGSVFSMVDDWKTLKAMLDGASGKPMTVLCPKSNSASFSYDPQTNTLVNEWEEYRWLCWPGSCGDLNFHWKTGTRSAKNVWEVTEFLRGELSR